LLCRGSALQLLLQLRQLRLQLSLLLGGLLLGLICQHPECL
jgi:hypothetical protein